MAACVVARNTNRGGRISIVDLLIKVACFVKKFIFSLQKGADIK
jgi:hypothetical protein